MRDTYYGGMVQVLKHVINKRSISVDFNSSYPFAMTQPMPWNYLGTITKR